jgi:hypothetical protein
VIKAVFEWIEVQKLMGRREMVQLVVSQSALPIPPLGLRINTIQVPIQAALTFGKLLVAAPLGD